MPEYLREEKLCVHRTDGEHMQTEAEIQGEGEGKEEKDGGGINQCL